MSGRELRGYLSGRIYYPKRVGWRWQVWYCYQDETADPNSGAKEWLACRTTFWRWISAARVATDMWCAFNDGVWTDGGRRAALEATRPDGGRDD
ncbi:MAG: hypothetical protein K5872_21970 [Rhizobiaceae bacterium]|nr:hypothetical protein [Rhizobiaceae bacterium]MCV0408887.1 hypothetical protein [Rhizobiaceae bacterium]